MYMTNISFAVAPEVQEKWLDIIKKDFIPFLNQNGFASVTLSRVVSIKAEDHFTYSLLTDVPDMKAYQRLTGELFDEYVRIATPLFGSQVVWFTSLMKKLN